MEVFDSKRFAEAVRRETSRKADVLITPGESESVVTYFQKILKHRFKVLGRHVNKATPNREVL